MDLEPRMVEMLASMNTVGSIRLLLDKGKPLPEQEQLGIGDRTVLLSSDIRHAYEFWPGNIPVVEIKDATEYKAIYPDYERRLGQGLVLGEWFTSHISSGRLGWFGVVELMPVDTETWETIRGWHEAPATAPRDIPDWLGEKLGEFYVALSNHSPGGLPQQVKCEKCESTNVGVHMSINYDIKMRIAKLPEEDGEERYTGASDRQTTKTVSAVIHCVDCRHVSKLDPASLVFLGKTQEGYQRVQDLSDPLD